MQLQSFPPPKVLVPPHPPPQQSRRIMMSQQEEPQPLPSLQEQPPPQFVADKSLIVLPPKIFYNVILCREAWAVYREEKNIFYLYVWT